MGRLTFETVVINEKIAVDVNYNLTREEYDAVRKAVQNFLLVPLRGVDVLADGTPATQSK